MVPQPAQRYVQQRNTGGFRSGLDARERRERRRAEVALAVRLAGAGVDVGEAARRRGGGEVGGGVRAGEEAAGEGVVDDDLEAVAAEGGKELGFGAAGCWGLDGGRKASRVALYSSSEVMRAPALGSGPKVIRPRITRALPVPVVARGMMDGGSGDIVVVGSSGTQYVRALGGPSQERREGMVAELADGDGVGRR